MNPGGPGWNDPPSLSYETHTQTSSRRNLLTKRVGLPDLKVPGDRELASSKNAEPAHFKKDLPPPKMKTCRSSVQAIDRNTSSDQLKSKQGNAGVSICNPNEGNTDELSTSGVVMFNPMSGSPETRNDVKLEPTESDLAADLASMKIDVVTELRSIAQKCQDEKLYSNQLNETILKKLAILESQILHDKLSDVVFEKVVVLTKYLILRRYDDAWNIHLTLVCDHSSSVMQWMVGVKKLISEAKKLEE